MCQGKTILSQEIFLLLLEDHFRAELWVSTYLL
jgi:hypothetical protein